MMGIVHLFWVISFIIVFFDIISYVLYNAACYGHKEVVRVLLNHNANIEAKDNHGNNPLIKGIFDDYYFF